MTMVFIIQFLIILVAMLAAGTFGYMLARHQARQNNDMQISMMSAEIMKMRRRVSTAQSDASIANARLSKERRRQRRS